ncbi:hypothetical protein pdam_00004482 [Pocillopora damicornis]|uniref:Transformation/transcription domain-associated protein n=1 Tax=Pocillopora damicornis TaxID=46731 RepID=A0A3M6URP8_POCDA|nr:hypothetical protein pdam_00004482 [Pocillopora damicornis]
MAASASPASVTSPQEAGPANIIKMFTTYTNILTEASVPEDKKLKAAQEISENFETIVQSTSYTAFLEHSIPRFVQYLRDGEPHFVTEVPTQQLRKLLLEILHRIPTNEHLRPHFQSILSLMFHLLEIQHFLQFVKTIYKDLPTNVKQFFDVVPISATGFLPEGNATTATTTTTPGINSGATSTTSPLNSGDAGGGKSGQQTLIPKAVNSLKVLAELPIIVVLMYQLYKQNVHSVVADFIPLIMNTIILQPSLTARKSPTFNKEVYVDFVAAQIKTLSFLAYIIRIYQDMVNTYSQNMVGGMLGLLRYCPQEVAHLRKELLIAARHILATDLRKRFVPHIDQLFDEEVLIGKGWTTKESLRPLAYSTLADLVHHVRTHLPLPHLSLAVHMFSKNVHDDSLPVSIQTMSCKLLLNLVEGIKQKSDDQGTGREILMRMLEVFVRKFQSIAKHHVPAIFKRCPQMSEVQAQQQSSSQSTSVIPSVTTSTAADRSSVSSITSTSTASSSSSAAVETQSSDKQDQDVTKKMAGASAVGPSPPNAFSVPDCRSMVKTLVCGVKTITWGAGSRKVMGAANDINAPASAQANKTFLPWETHLFTRLLKYALQALDIYQVSISPNGQYYLRPPSSQQVRMKEEKEILEHFAGVFTMMNTSTFKEVFTASIKYLVERIHTNYALQIIPNSFLANPNTSATFATILVRFLLDRLDEMGTNMERSNLYLKLFKLVFGSVSLFASENEQMLKPHLHEIVNRSMQLACTSKEPYNYFLLLRALFRSIGGGSHDLLYQEFLPLLPNLLQGLNNLQSGIHRQYMKDLFVELCLTVPVRLSSLLPYLPMLMDPLVSALNGSQTLVSQGLRTLELCVDNLQPDFLYDHIQPVRAELFQALWKTLRNPHDSIAHVAFRVLGKFGGGNRRMLKEPQKLKYNNAETKGPCLSIFYPENTNPVSLPVTAVIERALTVLKTLPPNMAALPQQSPMQIDHTVFYRKQAWLVVQSFLIAIMSLEDTEAIFQQVLQHKSFRTEKPPICNKTAVPPCPDEPSKKVFEQAITGALLSGTIKELKSEAVPFVSQIVRHYTIVGVVQQAGPCPIKTQARNRRGIDVHAMVDAVAAVMSMEDKEFYKVGELAVAVLIETASAITGDPYKAARLPLFEYLSEKLCGCCYERAWFAKNGGCTAINFLMQKMPVQWIIEHQLNFINALCFVMMDLTNEAQHSVSVLAEIYKTTVHNIMLPHKGILEDMIPPKKHLLRHQPVNTQIALMDGNTFCTTLNPRLFTMDLSIIEHKIFFQELLSLCEADDTQLSKLPCYKAVQSLTPLRKSALNALTACHYIVQAKDKIFTVLYKALNSPVTEIQEAAKDSMKKFMAGTQVDMEQVHMSIRPLLLKLGDYRSLNLQLIQASVSHSGRVCPILGGCVPFLAGVFHIGRVCPISGCFVPFQRRLSHLMELFPASFNEKLCEQLLSHLRKWIDVVTTGTTQAQQAAGKTNHTPEDFAQELKICASIINMFYLIPAASSKLIEHLVTLVLKAEKALLMEIGSPLRKPLLKFLVRYPIQTVDYFLLQLAGSQMNRLLMDGTPIHRWREPKLLAKCLLNYIKHKPSEVELLFQLLRVFTIRHVPDFHFLRKFLDETVAKGYTVEQKRIVFFKFVELFHDQNFPQELKAKVLFTINLALQYVLIPMFQVSFERGEGDGLIGGPPSPEQDSNENVISVFVCKVVDPDNPFGTSDAVRILLLQFSALLVEHASQHIHDAANKRQGIKLRRLMTFAWPCLLPKQCVDPSTKYHGHLLLAHIIAKFAIHKRIVLQVFHSLLKAHAVEARGVVRQALDILTPAMPARMEDGNAMLTHWTKKIIVEEGHTVAQLVHMLTLLVRHYRVYYPVRIHLIQHMVSAMQRLGFTTSASIEHRKLAVDLAEVILKWELQRIKDDQEQTTTSEDQTPAANYANVCTAIEILTYLLSVLPQQTILTLFKPLQRGIATCMTCQNTKVIRAIHTLLARLMTLFPLESSAATSKYDELETLYGNVGKVIFDGLTNYERSANGATSIFYGPLMMLKAACMNNPSYIDRLMTQFFKALQRMHKDHINAVLGESTGASDMLILCLELIRGRLGVMSAEIRKLFFIILTTLIEKSPDSKLLRAITKFVEDWIKTKMTQMTIQRLPTLREKSLLLVRMMANYEKRFPEDFELQAQFLELVNYVYRDETLVSTELASKLEPAFLSGLRCIQPQIRSRFMEVFDKTMKKKLYDRLLYVFCSQLLLAVSACERPVTPSSTFSMLPSVTSFLRSADNQSGKEILAHAQRQKTAIPEDSKEEKMETDSSAASEIKKEKHDSRYLFEIDDSEQLLSALDKGSPVSRTKERDAVKLLAEKHGKFMDKLREVKITHQQQQVIDFSPFEEDPSEINQHETLDALAEMYSLLNEEDMWAGLWQQRCRYPETATAIAYETQGFYEQAQSAYEVVREIMYSQPSS